MWLQNLHTWLNLGRINGCRCRCRAGWEEVQAIIGAAHHGTLELLDAVRLARSWRKFCSSRRALRNSAGV
jgi:hypothetical protein